MQFGMLKLLLLGFCKNRTKILAFFIIPQFSHLLLLWYQMYKGKLNDGTPVAIRSSKARKKVGQRDFTHHIELISKLRHSHLISALGHCFDCCQDDSSTSRIFNIFEFASNGTLRDYVSGKMIVHSSVL